MARGRATSAQQEQEIRRLVTMGITAPKQVYRHLEEVRLLENGNWVSEKTVARRIRELMPRDDSGPWSPLEADPEEVRSVAEVFRHVFRMTGARVWLTNDMMSWIRKVVDVAPSIRPNWAYAFGRAYRDAHARGDDTRCLDLALLEGLWRQQFVLGGEIVFHMHHDPDDPFIHEDPNTNISVIERGCELLNGEPGRRQLADLTQSVRDIGLAVEQGDSPDDERFFPRWVAEEEVRLRLESVSATIKSPRTTKPDND